jgi:large subunit ribosomal protein L23
MEKHILKKALISEKSFGKTIENKFSFIVDRRSAKPEIAETVESLFGVHVLAVNTTNYQGKVKKGKKGFGKRANYKKAILTLKAGEKIDLFDIEKPEDEKKKDTSADAETTVKVKEKKK